MSPTPLPGRSTPDVRAVVRALDALTTQVKRLANHTANPASFALGPPVAGVDDAPPTPATTCSARYTGSLPVGDCIRAAGHAPDIDHTDDSGRNFGDRSAEYPVHDGPELLGMRFGIDPGADSMVRIAHWLPLPEQQRRERQELSGMVEAFVDAQVQQARADEEQTLRWTRRESLLVLLTRLQRGRPVTAAEADTLRQHVETEISEADTARSVAAGNKQHVQVMYAELESHRAAHEAWKGEAEAARAELQRYAEAESADAAAGSYAERAERAEAAIERVRAHATDAETRYAHGRNDYEIGKHDLARTVLAALDGTDSLAADAPVCDAYQPPASPDDSGYCERCGMQDVKHTPAAKLPRLGTTEGN